MKVNSRHPHNNEAYVHEGLVILAHMIVHSIMAKAMAKAEKLKEAKEQKEK